MGSLCLNKLRKLSRTRQVGAFRPDKANRSHIYPVSTYTHHRNHNAILPQYREYLKPRETAGGHGSRSAGKDTYPACLSTKASGTLCLLVPDELETQEWKTLRGIYGEG